MDTISRGVFQVGDNGDVYGEVTLEGGSILLNLRSSPRSLGVVLGDGDFVEGLSSSLGTVSLVRWYLEETA